MIRSAFDFERPKELEATAPPEERGVERDGVRLLISDRSAVTHRRFRDLYDELERGDLLVVNESATVPASLSAHGASGAFLLNLSTDYGGNVWLAEPRWSAGRPGPVPLSVGAPIAAGPLEFRPIGPFPGIERLWFFAVEGDVPRALEVHGRPIRYGYVGSPYPLDRYQTVFARVPGSAEMPSAARPFTPRVLRSLSTRGIGIAPLVLHAGVSSLEGEPDRAEIPPIYPEPFEISPPTADRVNATRAAGHRVVAVGTTVLRALETAWDGEKVVPLRGFTRLTLLPGRPVHSVDGLLTGFHDPRTSHLALLFAFAGERGIRSAYAEAVRERYLWHEFGDSHLAWAAEAHGPRSGDGTWVSSESFPGNGVGIRSQRRPPSVPKERGPVSCPHRSRRDRGVRPIVGTNPPPSKNRGWEGAFLRQVREVGGALPGARQQRRTFSHG